MSCKRGTADARPLLVLLLLLALGVAGCGSGDSDATGASGGAVDADGERAANAMKELRTAYNQSDGETFCAGLTADGREEVLAIRRTAKVKAEDCAGIVTEFSKRVVAAGQPQRPVDVRRVTVNGAKARVVITGGLAGIRRVVPFRFRKIDGAWKLDDPLSGPSRLIRTDRSIQLTK